MQYNKIKFKLKNANGPTVTSQSAIGKKGKQTSLEFSLERSQIL